MKTKLLLIVALTSFFFSSCSNEKLTQENCTISNLGITSSDSLYQSGLGWKTKWKGRYSEELVEIHVDFSSDSHHVNRKDVGYVFKKVNNCLEFHYAYLTNISWTHNISARGVSVNEVIIQDWEEDKLFSGKIIETNNRGDRIARNFWVEFDVNNEYDFSYNANTTSNCIDLVTPDEIDLNNDGITDISLERVDINFPNEDFIVNSTNSIKLVTHNENSFLTGTGNYGLFIEAPFSTDNKDEYLTGNGWADTLSILFEFHPPYDRFNLWYANIYDLRYNIQPLTFLPNQTDHNPINNNLDDYLMVKIEKDGLFYYGWIKMKINFENCQFEIVETYLNPTPNEHVSVP